MVKFIFLFLLILSPLAGDLDLLIESTEWSLTQQKRLREQIREYQELQKEYLKSSEDNERLYALIKSAYAVLTTIKSLHLETAFDPDFISELSLLSKPATKSGLPKP